MSFCLSLSAIVSVKYSVIGCTPVSLSLRLTASIGKRPCRSLGMNLSLSPSFQGGICHQSVNLSRTGGSSPAGSFSMSPGSCPTKCMSVYDYRTNFTSLQTTKVYNALTVDGALCESVLCAPSVCMW